MVKRPIIISVRGYSLRELVADGFLVVCIGIVMWRSVIIKRLTCVDYVGVFVNDLRLQPLQKAKDGRKEATPTKSHLITATIQYHTNVINAKACII